ncbi:MAG TPA: hypothetical protein VK116_15170, partial [Planctomycetota bacterium]|nr:hypothetical protein [Planctomycetota bacterium]
MRRIRALGLGFALLGVSCPLHAQTKYPGVDAVFPLAVTRGQATEVEVRTNGDVQTAYAALVGSTNVRAEVVPRSEERKIPNQNAIVRIEPAADAPVGPCDLRLAARQAITTVCRIYITDLPAANESDDHGTIEKSQPIEIPSVMNGIVRANVETDWYRFEGKKGERLSFEVLGTRLHETIHKVGRFTPHFDPFL